jgi:hypothetical protein
MHLLLGCAASSYLLDPPGGATAKETSSTFGFFVCLTELASFYRENGDTFASSARGSAMIACQPCAPHTSKVCVTKIPNIHEKKIL